MTINKNNEIIIKYNNSYTYDNFIDNKKLIKSNNYFHNNCIEQTIFLSYLDQWDSLDIHDLAQHLEKECN